MQCHVLHATSQNMSDTKIDGSDTGIVNKCYVCGRNALSMSCERCVQRGTFKRSEKSAVNWSATRLHEEFGDRKLRSNVAWRLGLHGCASQTTSPAQNCSSYSHDSLDDRSSATTSNDDIRCIGSDGRHINTAVAEAQVLARETFDQKRARHHQSQMRATELREKLHSVVLKTQPTQSKEQYELLRTRVEHLRVIAFEVEGRVQQARRRLDSAQHTMKNLTQVQDRVDLSELDRRVTDLVRDVFVTCLHLLSAQQKAYFRTSHRLAFGLTECARYN
eukprot:m.600220 g.600220  ORF g.600220 m.600220 type:complete len:276 (-) comp22429_c0_seq10:1251-2078(-)